MMKDRPGSSDQSHEDARVEESMHKSRLDWDVIDAELCHIPPAYKEAKFDSLKHVLTVLGTSNSEAAMDELREQHRTVDGLVDDVVAAYYNGFTKALQNYSQILRLFQQSKAQVAIIRANVNEAKKRLGSTSRTLQLENERSIVAGDVCRLLSDVQAIIAIPPHVARLQAGGKWPLAVSALREGCERLAREEVAGVGALADVRKDMCVRRGELVAAIVAEVERRMYTTAIALDSDSSEEEDDIPELSKTLILDEIPALNGQPAGTAGHASARVRNSAVLGARRSAALASRGSHAHSNGRQSLLIERQGSLSRAGSSNLGRTSNSSRSGRPSSASAVISASPRARDASRLSHLHADSARRRPSFVLGRTQSGVVSRLHRAGGSGSLGRGALGSGDVGNADGPDTVPLPALLDALVDLAAMSEALQALRRRTGEQIRLVIACATEAVHPAPAGGDPVSPDFHAADAATVAAQEVLRTILAECQQIVAIVAAIMRLAAAAKRPLGRNAVEVLLRSQKVDGGAPSSQQPLTRAQAQVETRHAYDVMQRELQRVLASLLESPVATPGGSAAGVGWQTGRNGVSAPRDTGKLQFSFAAEAAAAVHALGGAATQGSQPVSSLAATIAGGSPNARIVKVEELRSSLLRAMGGLAGGMHLAPIMYGPTVSFTTTASQLVDRMWGDDNGGDGSPLARNSREGQQLLHSFMDSFVTGQFLPEVYIDFRGRCTKLLENPEAFNPRLIQHTPAPTSPSAGSVDKSSSESDEAKRMVLPAAVVADCMMSSLLLWAKHLPPFATHLIGVVESVIGRTLDAFRNRINAAVGSARAGALAASPAVARLMATEPAASQAGGPVAFFAGGPDDSISAFVTEVQSAGLGSGGEAAEVEVLARLLRERPVPQEALLTSYGGRCATIAALMDSLEYVADSLGRFTEHRSYGSQQGPGNTGGGLTDGLAHLLDSFRAAAGSAVRTLRIEMLLLMVHHLQGLARTSYVCDDEDTHEMDECLGAFTRAVAKAEEELLPVLVSSKRSYVFGTLASQSARFTMWLLPEIKEINDGGVARMNCQLSVLQPGLAAGGVAEGQFRPEAVRMFDRARSYFNLLTCPAEALVKAAVERPNRFTAPEWLALLQVSVPGRYVSGEHRAALQRAVASRT